MLDDFFTRAVLAGLMLALVVGPLGCFVVWRRLSYFGDTMAHAALLGVALSLVLSVNVMLAVFVVALVVALTILTVQGRAQLPTDALLGLLSHGALAIGLVALSFMTWIRFDLNGLLFGDLLAVSRSDLAVLLIGGASVIGILVIFWRKLFAVAVSREIAAAEGIDPHKMDLLFMVLLAGVVAVAIKLVGALLITAMLIMPAAAARRISVSPIVMAVAASAVGAVSVLSGLYASLAWNTPSGPSIVVAAALLFVLSLALPNRNQGQHHGT
jgi:zinc transport system permease protein